MTAQPYGSISRGEFLLFQKFLFDHSGILIPPEKAYLFETRLSGMMAEADVDNFGEFHARIASGAYPHAARKIVDAMATNETLWFRDASPWKVLAEILLPRYVGEFVSGRRSKVRMWFSAVSTGQEAYSTVMCVDDYLTKNRAAGVRLSDFEFFATDISGRVLDIAKKGRYDAISIRRGLGDEWRDRYFEKNAAAWDLDPKIRDRVRFSRMDLRHGYLGLGAFDVIFCRYVLIYFPADLKRQVLVKMRSALEDGGALFTGNYSLYDYICDGFAVKDHANCTYYEKRNT